MILATANSNDLVDTGSRPVLLMPLTSFDERISAAALRRLSDGDDCPHWLACLASSGLSDSAIATALTDVLHVRHAMSEVGGVRCPQVWILASLADPGLDASNLRGALNSARRELRRSNLSGRVCLMIYAGPTGGKTPSHDRLATFTAATDADAVVVVTDTSESGYRLHIDDAICAAGLQLAALARHGLLADRVVEAASRFDNRQVALGLAHVDISVDGIRQCGLELLRQQLAEFLLTDERSAHLVAAIPANDVDSYVTSLLRGTGGRIHTAATSVSHAVEALGAQERRTRTRQQAEHTRQAIAAELPVVRHPWWHRLLPRRFRPCLPLPTEVRSGARINSFSDGLATAELRGLQLVHLLMSAGRECATNTARSAWELWVTDVPDGKTILGGLLPSIETVAGRFVEKPLDELLAAGMDALDCSRELTTLCEDALGTFDPRAVLADSLAKRLIHEAAALASPLAPWGGSHVERWSLVPADVPGSWSDMLREYGFATSSSPNTRGIVLISIASGLTIPVPAGKEEEDESI